MLLSCYRNLDTTRLDHLVSDFDFALLVMHKLILVLVFTVGVVVMLIVLVISIGLFMIALLCIIGTNKVS